MEKISDKIVNKTASEKAKIKAEEISKLNHAGKFYNNIYDLDVEIISVSEIDRGVEVFARAWKKGIAIGFGDDGSVEIERFKIFNPPIFVDIDGVLVENSVIALRDVIFQTVLSTGKLGSNPQKNKVGRTTAVIYPTSDGSIYSGYSGGNSTFSTLTGASEGTVDNVASSQGYLLRIVAGTTSNRYQMIYRSWFTFDTSVLTSSAVISGALFYHYRTGSYTNGFSTTPYMGLVAFTPSDYTSVSSSDFDNFGSTLICDSSYGITSSGGITSTLNASGKSNISKTGYTGIGMRCNWDYESVAPTWSSGVETNCYTYFSEYSGTSRDPNLTITYSIVTPSNFFIMF